MSDPPSLFEGDVAIARGKAAQVRLATNWKRLDRAGAGNGVSHWKAQKQQDSFATLVTHMDRVSTWPQGCSRGRILESKQDPPNILTMF